MNVPAASTLPPFLAAGRRQPAPYTPIWIMRQAGRYLPEYRELRSKVDFAALTQKPELAAEATLQPLRRFELDAAILFSDIMTPVQGMGVVLESIRLVLANVPRGVPLIGFAGGPFTLLCYLVCGRPSKEFAAARTFLYAEPEAAERLLDRLADAMAAYLRAQAQAGAQALMLFES